MNTHNEDSDITCNSAYNPFPEPQTIPAGWDLSGLSSVPKTESPEAKDEDDTTES